MEDEEGEDKEEEDKEEGDPKWFGTVADQEAKGEECSICMDDFTDRPPARLCKCTGAHFFHKHCIVDWFKTRPEASHGIGIAWHRHRMAYASHGIGIAWHRHRMAYASHRICIA
eukprot:g1807.t1